ncbi:MAG: LPS export ABC transporter periplasmic protein LptC [bacterium]
MRRFKVIVPLLVVLAIGIVIGRVWRDPPASPTPQTQQAQPAQPPAIGLRQASIVLRHKGTKQAEVKAASVAVSRDLRYAVFKRIEKVTLYDKGQVALLLSTGEIVLDRTTNDLVARGEVEIASPQGDQLWAPEARWVNATQRLEFPQGVRLKVGGTEVTASRLNVDTRLQVFVLEGGVDITFQLPTARP